MCLTKIPTKVIFKLLSVTYFQNVCIVTCVFFVENNSALLCFLDVFGTALPVFSYKKHPTRSSIV